MNKPRYPWQEPGSSIRVHDKGGPQQRALAIFLERFAAGRPGDALVWDRYFEKWGEAPAATPPAFVASDVLVPTDRELSEAELAELDARVKADLQAKQRKLGKPVSTVELEAWHADVLADLRRFAEARGLIEPEPAKPPVIRLAESERDIVAVLVEAGRRLTAADIHAAMTRKGLEPSEGTLRTNLAALARHGLLDNAEGGYGLTSVLKAHLGEEA